MRLGVTRSRPEKAEREVDIAIEAFIGISVINGATSRGSWHASDVLHLAHEAPTCTRNMVTWSGAANSFLAHGQLAVIHLPMTVIISHASEKHLLEIVKF